MSDELTSAIIAAIVSLAVAVITWMIASAQFKAQYGSYVNAQKVAKVLLENKDWKLRSFAEIRRRLGGFGDDELRRLLVCCGAVRFHKNGTTTFPKEGSDDELWGLYERNKDAIK